VLVPISISSLCVFLPLFLQTKDQETGRWGLGAIDDDKQHRKKNRGLGKPAQLKNKQTNNLPKQ
jgi:hypothetical protein